MSKNGKVFMKKNNYFKIKKVLVTGSSSGILWQIAKLIFWICINVGVHYHSNKKGAEKIFKELKKLL